MGCGSVADRMLDPQTREPGLKSSCCRFEALAPHVAAVHSAVNEYLADTHLQLNELRQSIVFAKWLNASAWLNASQRSQDGIGMNSSAESEV